jgi:hypothetical protein
MPRQLATCSVCKTDQHVYKGRICNHTDGLLRCVGSREEVRPFTPPPVNEKVDIRYVKANGTTYLRAEDVATYIRNIAGGEETDVRNRMNEAANNILKYGNS